jgi:hypothetical protein
MPRAKKSPSDKQQDKITKIREKLPAGFADDADSFSTEKLKEEIVQANANIREQENDRDNDEKLSGAKELVKDYGAGYRDAIKAQNLKIKYMIHLLDQRGEV